MGLEIRIDHDNRVAVGVVQACRDGDLVTEVPDSRMTQARAEERRSSFNIAAVRSALPSST